EGGGQEQGVIFPAILNLLPVQGGEGEEQDQRGPAQDERFEHQSEIGHPVGVSQNFVGLAAKTLDDEHAGSQHRRQSEGAHPATVPIILHDQIDHRHERGGGDEDQFGGHNGPVVMANSFFHLPLPSHPCNNRVQCRLHRLSQYGGVYTDEDDQSQQHHHRDGFSRTDIRQLLPMTAQGTEGGPKDSPQRIDSGENQAQSTHRRQHGLALEQAEERQKLARSEERRVGKEGRSRWTQEESKKKST